MDFDQMMDAWKSQDERPLYGVNGDLLRLVLRHEQADIRRSLRWDQWTTYVVGTVMAAVAIASLWAFLHLRGMSVQAVAAMSAALGAAMLWIGALWLSRRRQAVREREFGSTLQEEVRRNLSLIDYRLSQVGRWSNLLLWSAPIVASASLIVWLIMEINGIEDLWLTTGTAAFLIVSIAATTYDSSRTARQELLPRRQRLAELLEMLNSP